jgi:hypothetical protein
MGTPPSAALQIQPQPSVLDTYGRVQEILNARTQNQIQQTQLQQAQQSQADQKAMTAAMQTWDGKDYTAIPSLVLKNGGSANAVFAATQHVQQMRQQAADLAAKDAETNAKNLETLTKTHDSYRGRLQAIIDAPDDQKQTLWQQEIATERAAGTKLDPQITDQYPGDATARVYANHFALGSVLAKEATENVTAQARKSQADTSASTLAGKLDPKSPLYDPSEASLQLKANQGDAQALSILAGRAKQSGAVAGSQAAAKLPYEIQAEVAKQTALQKMNPAAVAGVAPHLVSAATNAYDKAGQEYATAYQSAQNMQDFLNAARSGNKEAIKIVPLQGALEITTAQGVHRINRTEVDQFGGAGNLYDKLAGKVGGVLTGKDITDSVLNDMDAVQRTVSQNAAMLHANKVSTINASYGSKFQPMKFGNTPGTRPAGATMRVPGSDGKLHWSDGKADLGVAE